MKFKAQGLVEIGLLFAFIALIAIVTMSPIGKKINDSIIAMTPKKNSVEFSTTQNYITSSTEATATLNSNINLLASSSNINSQEAADFIKATLEIATKINEGNADQLTEADTNIIAENIKNNVTVETSGSLANMIADNIDKTNLSEEEVTALEEIEAAFSDNKISLDIDGSELTTSLKDFIAAIEASSLNTSDYDLHSDNPIENLLNAMILANDVELPSNLQAKADSLNKAFKNALTFE